MYIRTKDGVYVLSEAYWAGNKDEILAEADTIEELCDEFVGLIKDRNSDFIITKVIAHSLKELKDSLKTEFNGKTYFGKFDIIYGAIWTPKGLIYVAKMDNDGKLVLI